MKWLKRLMLTIACLLTAVAVLSGVSYRAFHGKPKWYKPSTATPSELAAAAQRAEDMLTRMHNWVADNHAIQVRGQATTTGPATLAADVQRHRPDEQFEIHFTDDELNAFFNKWADYKNRRASFEKVVDEPRLIMQEGRLILAGTVKELDTVVSMHFAPTLDSAGNLQLTLEKVMGGNLPLPDMLWASHRKKIEKMLRTKLPELQRLAKIDLDGSANGAAASASMNKLVLSVLHREPADAVVFVPFDIRDLGHTLPVKISTVKIEGNSLIMTAEQMTTEQRVGLLERLKAPLEGSSTNMNVAAVAANP